MLVPIETVDFLLLVWTKVIEGLNVTLQYMKNLIFLIIWKRARLRAKRPEI